MATCGTAPAGATQGQGEGSACIGTADRDVGGAVQRSTKAALLRARLAVAGTPTQHDDTVTFWTARMQRCAAHLLRLVGGTVSTHLNDGNVFHSPGAGQRAAEALCPRLSAGA